MAAVPNVSPGTDEVLGHADAGRRARDRDLAHGGAISGAGDFDVRSGDLPNLIDLAALSSNYAANELRDGESGNTQILKQLLGFYTGFRNSAVRV